MKYLILSDLHDDVTHDYAKINQIIDKYQDQVAAIFYNGDSTLSLADPIFEKMYSVLGNNDLDAFAEENFVEFADDQISILQVHGHLLGANFGLQQMAQRAKELGANLVTFGHTHLAMTEMTDGILFINPGSIGLPHGPEAKLGGTFVILDVSDQQFSVDFYDREFNHLDDLSQKFNR